MFWPGVSELSSDLQFASSVVLFIMPKEAGGPPSCSAALQGVEGAMAQLSACSRERVGCNYGAQELVGKQAPGLRSDMTCAIDVLSVLQKKSEWVSDARRGRVVLVSVLSARPSSTMDLVIRDAREILALHGERGLVADELWAALVGQKRGQKAAAVDAGMGGESDARGRGEPDGHIR